MRGILSRLQSDITAYLEHLVSTSTVPGCALAIKSGDEHVAGFAGLARDQPAVPPRSDTRYAVYSITKAVTALAALRLVDQGRLDLETPVSAYLEGWSDRCPDWEVKVSHLLSHTAGFTYGSRPGPVAEAYRRAGFMRSAPRSRSPREIYSTFSALPRLYPPGQGWSYSLASDVLGWVLSEVSGSSLAAVLRTEVFDPLNMTRSCLLDQLDDEGLDVAVVYEREEDRWRRSATAMSGWADPGVPQSGGASMATTLRDLMRLASAYVGRNPAFLSLRLWRLVSTNMLPNGGSLRTGLLSPLPGRTVDGVGYGAGVAVVTDGIAGGIRESLGEAGWEGSTGCFFFANPRLDLCAAFMANVYPHGSMPWWLELRRLIYRYYAPASPSEEIR
jgi:CubicO group peptidase (beta-lactamase class C family)